MSLAQVLSAYLNLNLLVVIAFGGLGCISYLLRSLEFRFAARTELKLHYFCLSIVVLMSGVHPLLPGNNVFRPAAKVWAAPSIQSFSQSYKMGGGSGYLGLAGSVGPSTLPADRVTTIGLLFVTSLLVLGGFFLIRDLSSLVGVRRGSFLIRRVGAVHIWINDRIHVPFSFWLPGQANIVVPSSLVGKSLDYRIAVAHEGQHHRQDDTRWVYVLWGLEVVCVLNPAIYLWNRWISEIQEFACDETLVDQGKVESQSYARCLVEVAQTAIHQKHVPVCATGLTFHVGRNLLKRRIENMFFKSKKVNWRVGVTAGALLASLLGVTAFASKGLIQDRRVNLNQAKSMAARAQSEAGFLIVVNDLVVKQLNRYVGTPEGREFMRDALARMENYKAVIGTSLQKYSVPPEIMAIPIVESGYQNLTQTQSGTSGKAAGIWQFIPQTARNYGMRVDDQKDERLDVAVTTDAAMRYLQANHLRFKDWHLSVLAYNMGEGAVQRGMDALRSRDAWTLIRNGYEGDKDYLPKMMAAILILKNPESLK